MARVATHRTLLPDDLIDKVHYDDNAGAAAIAAAIWRENRRTAPATLAYIGRAFDIKAQLEGYAAAIVNARKVPAPVTRVRPLGPNTPYVLAPWCYSWGDGMLFHDFLARHERIPQLAALVAAFPTGVAPAEAAAQGVDPATFDAWYRAGYLAPRP